MKTKQWRWSDVRRAVESVFIPGERKALLDAFQAAGERKQYKALAGLRQTEWRLAPLPVVTIEARLTVTRGALSEFTTLEVRANGEVGPPNGPWYDQIARTINKGLAAGPQQNPARAPKATPSPTRPSDRDIRDAIETSSDFEEFPRDALPSEFTLTHLGAMPVSKLSRYTDLSSWAEEIDDEEEMVRFRGREWYRRMRAFDEAGTIPPIIVVQGKSFAELGDGRGRVTYAQWRGIPLDVWMLKHRPRHKVARNPARRRNPGERPLIHTFEAAGLGVAPFDIVGFGEKGSCKFCGHVLLTSAIIQDANGKQFRVGEDCALRTGDAGMILKVQAGRKERAKTARATKKLATEEKERTRLYADATRLAAAHGLKAPVRPVADLSKWAGEENRLRSWGESEEIIAEARVEFTESARLNAIHSAAMMLEQWMRSHVSHSATNGPLRDEWRRLSDEIRAFRIETEYQPYGRLPKAPARRAWGR
jgi:hypothetical protein